MPPISFRLIRICAPVADTAPAFVRFKPSAASPRNRNRFPPIGALFADNAYRFVVRLIRSSRGDRKRARPDYRNANCRTRWQSLCLRPMTATPWPRLKRRYSRGICKRWRTVMQPPWVPWRRSSGCPAEESSQDKWCPRSASWGSTRCTAIPSPLELPSSNKPKRSPSEYTRAAIFRSSTLHVLRQCGSSSSPTRS